jgi:hypothetical protein
MPIIPALGRWRQEDCEFKSSLSYIARACVKNNGSGRIGGRKWRKRERERGRERKREPII